MKTIILKIGGMNCSGCQNRVEKYLNKQEGVTANVNLVMAEALINYDEKIVSIDDLERFIEESGYKSLGIYNKRKEEKQINNKYILLIYGMLTLLLIYISISGMLKVPEIPFLKIEKYPVNYAVSLLILTILFLIYGFDIIKNGIKKIISINPNMDSLVTIGIISSFSYSLISLFLIIKDNSILGHHLFFESSSLIIYFVKLGRFIEGKAKEKTKEAIKELVQITPLTALMKADEKEITIDEVKKGDILICKPGMKIAVDGVIVSGKTHIEEAFITGESTPVKKQEGSRVIAGSINIDGYIEYKAEKIGKDSTISEIVKLVIEATNSKPPIAKIADKISNYFVPAIILIAIITFIVHLVIGKSIAESIISFVNVLVISCPCALGLATPLAVVVSEGRCAKENILVKDSATLEYAHKIDTFIFDKTGTLTYGNIKISKIYNYSKYPEKEILNLAANIEKYSNHPIAKAFDFIKEKKEVKDFCNIPGLGISGTINNNKIYIGNDKMLEKLKINNKYKEVKELKNQGDGIIFVADSKNVLAIIGFKDVIRKNAKTTIRELKKMKKNIIILSGDNENTSKNIGKELGIDNIISEVLPQEKQNIISNLISDNHKVMMIGDGINDAPALAKAQIGVSINEATDIATDSADVIINNDLSKILDLIKISENTVKIIKQNMFWAFFYNILMIPIAIGLLKPVGITITPAIASISMTISSLTVVLNSLRLKKK